MLTNKPSPEERPTLRIKELESLSGRGVLTEFLKGEDKARARFRVRAISLSRVLRVEWQIKQFRPLGDGIFEIKWSCCDKEWRALGFDSDGYFLVVRGCTHKGRVYDPHDCIQRAKSLKLEYLRGKWKSRDYEL
jgi:hypothetical protein